MDLKQIQELIRFVAKSGVSEVELQQDDFKIVIKTNKNEGQMYVPMQQAQHQFAPTHQTQTYEVPAATANSVEIEDTPKPPKGEPIKSPMIGTFYSRPAPDKESFLKVGDMVTKGQVVCIIEAMKLFNEIESEISGRVVQILVDDSTPVEYDQPLFLVEAV